MVASRTGAVVGTRTAGISQEPLVRFAVIGEAFQCKCEVMQDGDVVGIAPLGLFGDEVARAEVGLAADHDDALIPVDVADLEA